MKTIDVNITCVDGYDLMGTVYYPKKVKAAIMIAPATGIKRKFYHSFACFLAANNYGVICFDNRGVGDSQKSSITSSKASLISWGALDMPAVLEKLKEIFPHVSYHIVGHSAGGQLIGLMHNVTDISSIFNVAASSGSLRNMHYPFKWKAYLFLNIFIPINNFLFGYTKSQWVGMGEPLPRMVSQQWSKWCNGKGYVEVDFGKLILQHWYDSLEIPSIWVHALDDDIANYKNVQDMVRVYSKISADIVTIDPKQYGYKEIGHMKFFNPKYESLWILAQNWFQSFKG